MALLIFAIASVLMVLHFVAVPFATEGDLTLLVFFGLAWLATIAGLVCWAAAMVAAAFGKGVLPRYVIAAAFVVLGTAAVISGLSLPQTGAPEIVAVALGSSGVGTFACIFAWLRTMRATAKVS